MAYSCSYSKGGHLDFLDFLQKMFYNIDYRARLHFLFPFPEFLLSAESDVLKITDD